MTLSSLSVYLTISLVSQWSVSFPVSTPDTDADTSASEAFSYLSKFGYIPSSSIKTGSLVSLDSAVADFQAFAGLEVTGKLDSETIDLMRKPRCGVKDFQEEDEDLVRNESRRAKRYALQGSRWKVKDLTYRISKYPFSSGLSRNQVDDVIRDAFDVWEKETDLKFNKRSSGKVHIDIRFERGNHGDDDPFDGEGGTLAHAFFPVYGGDAHFDDQEDWTVNTYRGTSLLMTAAHELGHSLGLSHSNVRSSLMAPFYRGYDPNLSLEQDDIRGIQALYGAKTIVNTPPSVTPSPSTSTSSSPPFIQPRNSAPNRPEIDTRTSQSSPRDLCDSRQLDTITTMEDDITYAFLGDQYWKLTDTSVAPGYPRSISENWDNLPGDLDASFTWINGKTYFFKGSKYYRFSDPGSMDFGYPKDLDKGFSGIPENVDAAFVWPVNNKIYFFKDSLYWKFDPDLDPPVASSYPRPISNWDGIPNNLDAALQYSNGKSYFFKSGQYYRFDDERFIVDDRANPGFPRDSGFWWFGCQKNSVRLSLPDPNVALY